MAKRVLKTIKYAANPSTPLKAMIGLLHTVSDVKEQSSTTVSVDILLEQIDPSTKIQFGGAVGAPVASENYLYVPHGSIITVVDLRTQDQANDFSLSNFNPTKTEVLINAVAQMKALEIVDEYLYALLDSGKIAVFSLDKPNMPEPRAECDFSSSYAEFIGPTGALGSP